MGRKCRNHGAIFSICKWSSVDEAVVDGASLPRVMRLNVIQDARTVPWAPTPRRQKTSGAGVIAYPTRILRDRSLAFEGHHRYRRYS